MLLKYACINLLKRPYYNKLKYSYQNRPAIEKNVIFVHIPKAAGTSIHKSLFGRLSGFGHSPAHQYIKIYGVFDFYSSFRFAFVRNPFDRALSTYNYLRKGGNNSNDKLFFEKYLSEYTSFEDFVLNGLNKSVEIQNQIHFRTQRSFIYHENRCLVSFVGRFENIQADYEYVSNILGVDKPLVFTNKSTAEKNYLDNYNNREVVDVITSIYSCDFEQFGYQKNISR